MGVYEVCQKADFTLGLRMPKTIKDSFIPASNHSDVTIKDGSEQIFTGSADTGYRIDGTITYTDSKEFGITFGRDYKNKKGGYQFSFNPTGGLLKFDAIGRQINAKGIERPIRIKPGQDIKFSLIIEGEVAVLYVNDEIVLSSRIYEPAGNDIGFYSSGGSASVADLEMLTFKG
jgi:beta-fructofuranosidase